MVFSLCAFSFLLIMCTKTPFTISMLLVLLSLQVAILAGTISSPWLFLVIALIFLGGMMVMFLYISTLSISEKLSSPKLNYLVCFFVIFLTSTFVPWQNSNFSISVTMLKPLSLSVVLILVLYLTLALLLAVKFTQSFKGAISKKW